MSASIILPLKHPKVIVFDHVAGRVYIADQPMSHQVAAALTLTIGE